MSQNDPSSPVAPILGIAIGVFILALLYMIANWVAPSLFTPTVNPWLIK